MLHFPELPDRRKGRMDILQAIGNTSMVRLRKVVPPHCAAVFVKLEWENPTGSVKDRMAQAVIARAEADGRLKPGRHGRRIHRRQHRGVAGAGLRRARLPDPDRHLRRLRAREARSDGGAGRRTHDGAERGRPDHQEADPRHDRGRPQAEPGAAHLLDRSAQQPRQHRRLLPAGRARSGGRPTARSTPSCTRSAPAPARAASRPC